MPISPDSKYVIKGMHESFAINDEERAAIYAYDIDVDSTIDHNGDLCSEACAVIYASAGRIDPQKTIIALKHLLDSNNQFAALINAVSHKSLSQNVPATKIVGTNPFRDWILRFRSATKRAITHLDSAAIMDDIMTEHHRHIQEYKELIFASTESLSITSLIATRTTKRNLKAARKAALRGISLFKSLFGSTDIDAFLAGDEIRIEGLLYNYCIRSKGDIISRTLITDGIHVPYHITIETKDGIIIGSGCTTFDSSPVIDQLISFILCVRDDEENILINMNITNRTEEYKNQSKLKAIKGLNDLSIAQIGEPELEIAPNEMPSKQKLSSSYRSSKSAVFNALKLPPTISSYLLDSNKTGFDEFFDIVTLDFQINRTDSKTLKKMLSSVSKLSNSLSSLTLD